MVNNLRKLKQGAGKMHCTICKEKDKNSIELLGINVCETCFSDISTIPVCHKKYDYYKEVIKVVLKNYIYERVTLNPVK
jgi:hypothetical protein